MAFNSLIFMTFLPQTVSLAGKNSEDLASALLAFIKSTKSVIKSQSSTAVGLQKSTKVCLGKWKGMFVCLSFSLPFCMSLSFSLLFP